MIASSWIDGAAVVTGGGRHQVINPADGSVVAEFDEIEQILRDVLTRGAELV